MLQDRPTATDTTTGVLDDPSLDKETRAILDWLKDVCSRSTTPEEQLFIFRDLSWLNKIIRRDRRGEIKAVRMSDLTRVHNRHIRALHESRLIQFRKGRWPGKWFTVGR